jgi:predicted lipid-binding transport protein (Tim44 family)
MDTASFTGLIKAIVTIVLIYYIAKFFMKMLAPVLVQQMVKKAGQTMQDRQQEFYNAQDSQRQQQEPAKRPEQKPKVGEYIDFEEIE